LFLAVEFLYIFFDIRTLSAAWYKDILSNFACSLFLTGLFAGGLIRYEQQPPNKSAQGRRKISLTGTAVTNFHHVQN
jgi:hypothetical protein